jgi:hypothetical protein
MSQYKRLHYLVERQRVHLEATEFTRHQHAVEFGVMQRLHDWVCEMTLLFTTARVFSDQGRLIPPPALRQDGT